MGTSVTINFVAGPAVAANSSISASANSAPADGSTAVQVTVQFKDATGNPTPGRSLGIQGHGSAVVTPAAVLSDANGSAVFSITDTVAENLTISGFDANDTVATPTVNIDFTAVTPADNLDIEASSPTDADDGVTADTLTVVVTSGGVAVPGKTISIQQSAGGHATISPSSVVTDASGTATFTVTDAHAEGVTFTPVEA